MTYSLIYQCKLWCAYLTCEKYKTEHTNYYIESRLDSISMI